MFEVFTVAVKLSLISNVTNGLLGMSQQFAKTHGSAVALQSQLNRIRLTMMAGGALVAGGAFGFMLIGKAVKPATEYAHQLAQMRISGMKNLEIARATAAAWNASKTVPTSTAAENLAAIRELRMVFGDTNHAIANMPVVQRLQAILQNTKGGGARDEAYTVAKALEMKGAVRNPAEFNVQANLMSKAIVASGGKVGAQDFLSAFKYGRAATNGWNDAFTYSILPTLIQEMKSAGGSGGAGGPGNALMSSYAAVVGGTITQRALKVWQKLGLLDPSKIEWTKVGEAKGVRPGGIAGSALFQTNPFEWTQKVLIPAMQSHGIKTDADVRQTLQYLFANRTAGFVMQQMATQAWKFTRDQRLIGGAQGLSAYNTLLRTDPVMASIALQKQWTNLLAIIGYQIMPVLVSATLKLIGVLTTFSEWASRHQTTVRVLVYAFATLSAAMMFGGTVLLLSAAIDGLKIAMGAARAVALVSAVAFEGILGPLGAAVGIIVAGGLVAKGIWDREAWLKKQTPQVQSEFWGNTRKGMTYGRDAYGRPVATSGAASPFVAHHGGAKHGSGGDVYMDGKKVGKIVSGHIVDALGKPQTGTTWFDPSQSLAPVGLGTLK